MNIQARLKNSKQTHTVVVETNGVEKDLLIPAKSEGQGSSINGGELLLTALATCYCNDIYREAARRKIEIASIHVNVTGEFGGEGEPAKRISYAVKIDSPANQEQLQNLIRAVDAVAEIHNTLRNGIAVNLEA